MRKICQGLLLSVLCAPAGTFQVAIAQATSQHHEATPVLTAADEALLRQANEAFDHDQPKQALALYRQLLVRNPEIFAANENVGLIYVESGDSAQALPFLKLAALQSPDQALAHANLGAALIQAGDAHAAVPELERAVSLDPQDAQSANNLAHGYMAIKEPAKAATMFGAAVQLAPPSSDLLYNWAVALLESGDAAKASQALDRIPASNINDQSEALAGEVDERLGQFQPAVGHLRRAAELNPSEPNIDALAVELLRHWSWQTATEVCAYGRKRFPSSARLAVAQGIAEYGGARYTQAAETFSALLQSDPDSALYADMLGRSCTLLAENAGQQCGLLQSFADTHPKNATIETYAGTSILHEPQAQQDLARAETLLRNAIKSDPKASEAYFQLGVLQQQKLQWQDSLTTLGQAVALRPAFAEAHYRLARAYYHLHDQARGDAEIALQRRYQAAEKEELDRELKSVTLFLFTASDQGAPPSAP